MTVSHHRSRFELLVTTMLVGCLAGAGAGAVIGVLTRASALAEVGLLSSAALLAGCVVGALAGVLRCMALRRPSRPEAVTIAVERLPAPGDRRPGWHADPAGAGQRLWDGEGWTQHVWSGPRRSL